MGAAYPDREQSSPMKFANLWLVIRALVFCSSAITAGALTAVDDSATTLPETPLRIEVLANDAVPTNATAILRVTQPAHGRVILNSTFTIHAELTPLFQFAARQLSNTVMQVAITNFYPWYLTNGVWRSISTNTPSNPDKNWISGFFPGSLWMIYEYTSDANFRNWAQMWQAALAPEQYSTAKDDVSFIINPSFGNGYRITGNPEYKDILTQTCRSFTNRWNPIVGCFADDQLLTPPPFEVIMDTMVNTEIFYRPDLDKDTNMLAMAISHAGRTLTNHLRADGSTFHRVMYDGVTNGSVLFKDNRVPIGALDTWARGHSWATHAFPLLYRHTGDGRFLDTAKKVADFYINNAPADSVPYWYYPSNIVNSNLLRDSSAGAVTLSGLLDLSQQVTNDADGAKYWLAAHRLFASLSSTNYLAVGTTNAILLHGNPVDANTDTSLIYGDYYFIESLERFNDLFNQTSLTYIPAANFTGNDTFTYQSCDSSGGVSVATVTVTVGFNAQISLSPVTSQPVISFPTTPGKTYFVQRAESLSPPLTWSLLATNLAGSGSVLSVTDTNPATGRFYQIGRY
jgi:unsaturated chondroitin disaccharide hydrolase